jgi:hypothetical protein
MSRQSKNTEAIVKIEKISLHLRRGHVESVDEVFDDVLGSLSGHHPFQDDQSRAIHREAFTGGRVENEAILVDGEMLQMTHVAPVCVVTDSAILTQPGQAQVADIS